MAILLHKALNLLAPVAYVALGHLVDQHVRDPLLDVILGDEQAVSWRATLGDELRHLAAGQGVFVDLHQRVGFFFDGGSFAGRESAAECEAQQQSGQVLLCHKHGGSCLMNETNR